MNKICLIIPPSPFLLDERVFPFLGILKVASAWEKMGASIDVLDLGGIENYLDVVSDYFARNKNIEFVGVTATTPQMPNAYHIGNFIKSNFDLKLVLGGPHVTLMHTASKRERIKNSPSRACSDIEKIQSIFDILVCGDGEFTLDEIRKIDFGVIDGDDRKSPLFMSNKGFTETPFPARHLIDLNSYHYYIEEEKATSLISQLGCPFKCSFCSGRNSPFLRNIRSRSTQSVIDELESLYLNYGYKAAMLYDDELNVNKQMIPLMYDIARLGDKYGFQWKLRGFTKSELFTDEQAKAMVAAGFKILLTGFESGDERILKNIRKNATRDDNTRCVEIAKKYGLKIKALMSIGHAGESHKSIENTKKWLLDVEPDDFDCTVITCYPGSPYFDDAIKTDNFYTFTSKDTGDRLYQKEIDYTKDSDHYKGAPGSYASYVWTDNLSPEELVTSRDHLENEVRSKLDIPFNSSNPARKYEHSMGQGNIPDWILRSSSSDAIEQKQKIGLRVL